MNSFYENMTHRTLMVIGQKAMDRLGAASVIIFGVGGVGSWCAESLVRTGLMNLTMVDSDIVCPTNINRQAQALARNVGESKVAELKKRLLEINPSAAVAARHETYDENSCADFDLGSYDYVIDAIDSIRDKVLLIEQCIEKDVTIYSSMGAGAKTDPSKIRIDLLSRTKNCPLARNVRRRLRQDKAFADILCVYSEELPAGQSHETISVSGAGLKPGDDTELCLDNGDATAERKGMIKRVNGSLVTVTGIFGFMLAGLVINDMMARAAADPE